MVNDFSPDQARRRVDNFFAKMRIVWGNGAFNQQFGNELDLRLAKQEFWDAILKPSDEELRMAFDHAKKMIANGESDWRYPHPEKILSGAKKPRGNSPDVVALLAHNETPEQKAERIERGKSHIANLKAMFDKPKPQEAQP
jgi:hypothetical protein